MRINSVCKGLWITAALGIVPLLLNASPAGKQTGARLPALNPVASNPTPALLERIQDEAASVKKNAEELGALLREPFLSDGQSVGLYLDQLRAHVNELNRLVFQLRAGEAQDRALQKQVIEWIAPTAANLADSTHDALDTFNQNQTHLYATGLAGLANHIYQEAKWIGQELANFEKYSTAQREVNEFGKALGLQGNS